MVHSHSLKKTLGISCLLLSAHAFADGSSVSATKSVASVEATQEVLHAATGEGQTLPRGVFRVKSVNKYFSGNKGYDQDGKKVKDNPAEPSYKLGVSALVLEYGALDKLSLQVMAPFVFKNQVSVKGMDYPKGATGLADMELGALYRVLDTSKLVFSAGAGTRLPTGSTKDALTKYPISQGLVDLGLRLNLDYTPVNGLWLSWQTQHETAVTKAKRDVQSPAMGLVDEEETVKYSKKGVSTDSFLKANFGLGVVNHSLKSLAVNTFYNYTQTRSSYLDGELSEHGQKLHYAGVGGLVSGIPYSVPVELDMSYAVPFAGQNAPIATNVSTVALRVYTQF